MSDPESILDSLDEAEDAFSHAGGPPEFEPGVNASPDAEPGEVPLQKACRLLTVTEELSESGSYYGAVLESSFIVIEQTLQAYLLSLTGVEAHELRDHDRPYKLASGRVPLTDETLERVETLYHSRRTDHYYGTTVTTHQQATAMRSVAVGVHDHLVDSVRKLEAFCNCPDDR